MDWALEHTVGKGFSTEVRPALGVYLLVRSCPLCPPSRTPMRSLPRHVCAVEPGAEQVVLVDERDRRVGVAAKMAAHIHGWRHRALSVFVFNDRHELLLQKRSAAKYHSGNLWSNTCCGHPRPGEQVGRAAKR